MTKEFVNIFISYAHDDKAYFDDVFKPKLKNHLASSLKYDFKVWDDAEIPKGANWHDVIQENLEKADVAVLCISGAFFNSEYIKKYEFEQLINNYPNTLIIPVYFLPCNIRTWAKLSKIQFFIPEGDKYGMAGKEDFSFGHLVVFTAPKVYNPNANIETYLKDLTLDIEVAWSKKKKPCVIEEEAFIIEPEPQLIPKPQPDLINENNKLQQQKNEEKIFANIFLAAIPVFFIVAILILLKVIYIEKEERLMYVLVMCFMFLFCSFLFMIRKKLQHS
jgi:TIR domain